MNPRQRIAKLRALAARPGTPAEGETARRLADEIAAKLPIVEAPEPRPIFLFDEFGRIIVQSRRSR